jgi:hypothetical protein
MTGNVTGKQMRDKRVERHLQGEYILSRPNWHRDIKEEQGDGQRREELREPED